MDDHFVSEQIDAALEQCGALDESSAAAVEAAQDLLLASDDEW